MATGTKQKNMVLLWENPSPESPFAEQTISLDLSEYTAVLVIGNFSTFVQWSFSPCILFVGSTSIFTFIDAAGYGYTRQMDATVNGVKFYNEVNNNNQTRNEIAIPYRIYGLKDFG